MLRLLLTDDQEEDDDDVGLFRKWHEYALSIAMKMNATMSLMAGTKMMLWLLLMLLLLADDDDGDDDDAEDVSCRSIYCLHFDEVPPSAELSYPQSAAKCHKPQACLSVLPSNSQRIVARPRKDSYLSRARSLGCGSCNLTFRGAGFRG